MIDKTDCVSITDRTFDLSLDDPLSDTSSTAVNSATEQGATTDGSPIKNTRLQSILTDDIIFKAPIFDIHRFSDAQVPPWKGTRHVLQPVNQVNRTTTSLTNPTAHKTANTTPYQRYNEPVLLEKLKKSISQLTELSGNTVGSSTRDMDLDSLVEMVSKLTEAGDYKMKFLTKNYSFLESMYDTSCRELDAAKLELSRAQDRQLQLEEALRQHEQKEVALRQQLQNKENTNRTVAQSVPEYNDKIEQARQIIERQQREIKEYKLFIKQMMDRE